MAKKKRMSLSPLKLMYHGMRPGQTVYLQVRIISITVDGTDRVTASVDIGSGIITVPGERLVRSSATPC